MEGCLVGSLKQIYFTKRKHRQNGMWLEEKDLFIKDSSIWFYMNKLIRIHVIIVLLNVCCLLANLYNVLMIINLMLWWFSEWLSDIFAMRQLIDNVFPHSLLQAKNTQKKAHKRNKANNFFLIYLIQISFKYKLLKGT